MPIAFGETVTKTVPVPPAQLWEKLSDFSHNLSTVFGVPAETVSYGGGSNVVGAHRTTTVHGPLLTEKLTMIDPSAMEFEYYLSDIGPFPDGTEFKCHWKVQGDGDGGSVVTATWEALMDVPDSDELPQPGQPPFATRRGVQLVFRGAYKASIDNAAKLATA